MTENSRKRRNVLLIALAVLLLMVATLWLLRCCRPTPSTDGTGEDGIEVAEQQGEAAKLTAMQDLTVGSYYRVEMNNDTLFALVTAIDEGKVEGVLYPLYGDAAKVDPVPFSNDFSHRNGSVEVNDSTYSFRRADEMLGLGEDSAPLLFDRQGRRYRFRVSDYHSRPLEMVKDSSYRKALYEVNIESDILYGTAKGHWTSNVWDPTKNYVRIVVEGVRNAMSESDLPLKLDLYSPQVDGAAASYPRPLILWLHGGSFYVNDKSETSIVEWCKYFASMGYHCASIDYRQGFLPTPASIGRTSYMAVQDAHAAMRYLVHHADRYGINKDALFVAGASAGSITALNLIFMTERERPACTYGRGAAGRRAKEQALIDLNRGMEEDNNAGTQASKHTSTDATRHNKAGETDDLGPICSSGNSLQTKFSIKAIANLWGAMPDVEWMSNNRANIVSVHGDADVLVPYEKGNPFQSIPMLGKVLMGELHGSASIHRKACELGMRSTLVTLPGKGHAPQYDSNHRLNMPVFNLIKDSITDFFYDELVPTPATIVHDSHDIRHYHLSSIATKEVHWEAEGGFIVRQTQRDVWVVWRGDVANHCLRAVGRYHNGIAFSVQYELPAELALALIQPQYTEICSTSFATVSR